MLRCDIYALGIVAWEMLTGKVPYSADTPVAVLMKHVNEPLPLPLATEMAEPVLRVLMKCLAKDREGRWQKAGAFVKELAQSIGMSPSTMISRPEGVALTVTQGYTKADGATATVRHAPDQKSNQQGSAATPPTPSRWISITVGAALVVGVALAGVSAIRSLRILGPSGQRPSPTPKLVRPGSQPGRVKVTAENEDIHKVLLGIASEAGINVVVDRDVNGLVRADLNDVPWDKAFELLLKAHKLAYAMNDNVVRIFKLDHVDEAIAQVEKEPDWEVVLQLAEFGGTAGFGGAAVRTALPILEAGLTDPVTLRRVGYAGALALLDAQQRRKALPVLESALADSDANARYFACSYLKRLGPDARATFPALRKLFADPSRNVRSCSAGALRSEANSRWSGHPISMSFPRAEVRELASLFRDISGLDMLVDEAVSGRVTIGVQEMPWDQALDLVLKNQGLGYEIDGDVLRIAPLARFVADHQEERSRKLGASDAVIASLTKSCDRGGWSACSQLGLEYLLGRHVESDIPRAVSLIRKACASKDNTGCDQLGQLLLRGEGVQRDEHEAVRLFRQACEAGLAGACANLGWCYMDGRGIAKNVARAIDAFEGACQGDFPAACNTLAVKLFEGEVIKKDVARAVVLYEKGCELGSRSACFNLAEYNETYPEAKHDNGQALTLYAKACDAGHATACAAAGFLHEGAPGVVKDLDKAKLLLGQACNYSESGCREAAEYFERAGFWKSPERASKLYQLACDRGDEAACARVNRTPGAPPGR